MPLLKIHTNQSLDNAAQTALLQKASSTVAELLGKPERYVMIALDTDQAMLFAGSDAPPPANSAPPTEADPGIPGLPSPAKAKKLLDDARAVQDLNDNRMDVLNRQIDANN